MAELATCQYFAALRLFSAPFPTWIVPVHVPLFYTNSYNVVCCNGYRFNVWKIVLGPPPAIMAFIACMLGFVRSSNRFEDIDGLSTKRHEYFLIYYLLPSNLIISNFIIR